MPSNTWKMIFSSYFERIKAEVQVTSKEKKEPDISDSAEGMHAAIQDIVKAMQEMTHHLI